MRYCLPRFQTDANCGGTEKLSVTLPAVGSMKNVPKVALDDVCSDQGLMPPLSLFFVKGWTRAVSACTVMACCVERADFYKAGRAIDALF